MRLPRLARLPLIVSLSAAFIGGCSNVSLPTAKLTDLVNGPPDAAPSEEWFVALPIGLPTGSGPAFRRDLDAKIKGSPAGTFWNFFFADSQEHIATFEVPAGSPAYREDQAKQTLAPVYERLDPELAGGSLAVDLIALPASVRKYRKTDLPPRVVVVGSMLTIDREGIGSITKGAQPCDGCVTAAKGPYARMESFPEGTLLNFYTATAGWGNGPNHRNQVEQHQRYVVKAKQGDLLRVSSDSAVVFDFASSQWDKPAGPRDKCNGLKKVVRDKPKTKTYDDEGTEVIQTSAEIEIKVRRPLAELLRGPKKRVLFMLDTSGSVIEEPNVFAASQRDVCEKLRTMPMQHFAVVGFGGDQQYRSRISKHPRARLSGGLSWAEATPHNRDEAIRFVQSLMAWGGTPTREALGEALRLEGPMMVCLYSDGIPTLGEGGMSGVIEDAKELKKAGITVNTIGIGSLSARSEQFDFTGADFLARLSIRTGGEYFALE